MHKTFLKLFIFIVGLNAASLALGLNLQQEPAVQKYIAFLHNTYHFDQQTLENWFKQVQFNQQVLNKINQPPGEVIPWYQYHDLFITPKRIQRGVAFWHENAQALKAASHKYGVPPEIMAGIIGVETSYGENKGQFSEMDALATLAFKYPRRSQFFMSELTNFLLLSREQNWDPFSIKASYAGALGLPQFMPSSYRLYGVNADNQHGADLINDPKDAIYSIANYMKGKGWQSGIPVAVRAQVTGATLPQIQANGKLYYTVKELAKYGIKPSQHVPGNLRAGVLYMEGKQGTEVWMTFANFQVIRKYNLSNRYALVVDELGTTVKQKAKHG
ncbi:MAG: lytic murein transglycosylase B [Gammaproteobacteria bacterium]